MKQIRKVCRPITVSDEEMAKSADITIERISSTDILTHLVFGNVIQKLVNIGFEVEVFELHCQGTKIMLWIKEDFGLLPGKNKEGEICFGVIVNTKIDEGMIGAFVRILTKNNIEHQITHAISFDESGHPIIRPAVVEIV